MSNTLQGRRQLTKNTFEIAVQSGNTVFAQCRHFSSKSGRCITVVIVKQFTNCLEDDLIMSKILQGLAIRRIDCTYVQHKTPAPLPVRQDLESARISHRGRISGSRFDYFAEVPECS